MELAKIEALLEQYFEGNTSLEQEAQLEQYFTTAKVPEHLAPYKQLFSSFTQMREQELQSEFQIPQQQQRRNPFWGYAAAALIGVLLSVGLFMNSNADGTNELTAEEKQALEAFEKAKEALQMMSHSPIF